MDFHGARVNFGRNLYRVNGWSIDFARSAARYLYLREDLTIQQDVTHY